METSKSIPKISPVNLNDSPENTCHWFYFLLNFHNVVFQTSEDSPKTNQ